MNIVHRLLAALCACWLRPRCRHRGRGMATCTGKISEPADRHLLVVPAAITIGSATTPTSTDRRTTATTRAIRSAVAASIRRSACRSGSGNRRATSRTVRKPFCLPSLGGLNLDPGIAAPEAARFTRPEGDGDGGSFYQAHFTPTRSSLVEVVTDFPCLERAASTSPT